MDLSTMMANVDLHKYSTASAFLDDIFLICRNALEYNPDRGPTGEKTTLRPESLLFVFFSVGLKPVLNRTVTSP